MMLERRPLRLPRDSEKNSRSSCWRCLTCRLFTSPLFTASLKRATVSMYRVAERVAPRPPTGITNTPKRALPLASTALCSRSFLHAKNASFPTPFAPPPTRELGERVDRAEALIASGPTTSAVLLQMLEEMAEHRRREILDG